MRRHEVLARVVRAREALADGDLALVGQTLADLEEDLQSRRRATCPDCGLFCGWPGVLEEHVRTVHPEVWEATVAA